MRNIDFNQEWISRYSYTAGDEGEQEGVHMVRLEPDNEGVVVRSLPDEPSELEMRLTLEDNILSGTWRERTSLTGHYKGEVFHGVVQLIMNEELTRSLDGKWAGFNERRKKVNVGNWSLIQKQ